MTGTRLALTRRAHLILDLLDNRDGTPLRPVFVPCQVCGERATSWRGEIVCPTRLGDATACPGNSRRAAR